MELNDNTKRLEKLTVSELRDVELLVAWARENHYKMISPDQVISADRTTHLTRVALLPPSGETTEFSSKASNIVLWMIRYDGHDLTSHYAVWDAEINRWLLVLTGGPCGGSSRFLLENTSTTNAKEELPITPKKVCTTPAEDYDRAMNIIKEKHRGP